MLALVSSLWNGEGIQAGFEGLGLTFFWALGATDILNGQLLKTGDQVPKWKIQIIHNPWETIAINLLDIKFYCFLVHVVCTAEVTSPL